MIWLLALAVGAAVASLAILGIGIAQQLSSSHRLRLLLGKYVRGQNVERPPLLSTDASHPQAAIHTASKRTSKFISHIDEQLAAAGILVTARQWLALLSVGSVAIGLTAGLALEAMPVGLSLAAALFIGAIKSYLPAQIRRRQERFAKELPHALQAIAASLRSGQSLSAAVDGVAQLHKGEVSFQFQRALAEVQFGARLDEALSRVSERMNNEDLKWLVLALEIHRELGGPLSEVVDSVAQTLSVRAELQREVRVLAAEGKLSAMVLVAVPFVAFAALFVLRREYLSFFWTKPLGFAMLAGFCALMLAGWMWLRSILKQE
jgi:tight adherence protein B